METIQEIERSIITKYRKSIWRPFTKAINTYRLLKDGDKIAVCISGGKDSMLLAKCFQELKKHGKIAFELVFLVMDPGYQQATKDQILKNASLLNIPITMFQTDIFETAKTLDEMHPCYMCARMRRGYLYHKAKDLGCNKIALGHHFDDVIETILLSMLYGGEIKTMMPKLHSKNYQGMELIRPLYLVKEAAIVAWAKQNSLTFINCACQFTEKTKDTNISKRQEMKELIATLRQKSTHIEQNIFKSVENVNLDTVICYHNQNGTHHFLDDYEQEQ